MLGVPGRVAKPGETGSVRPRKSVIVIGAGVTGLVAAYELIRKGFLVTVIEASDGAGGLAGSFFIEGNPVEKYYHFICRGDNDLIELIHDLGIAQALHWRAASTGFFIQDRMFGFNGPWDLVKFSPLSFMQRLRFGLNVLVSQHRTNWHGLDKCSARDWLLEQVGPKAYAAIWDPLLRIKFGQFHGEISAAWIWHRIHRFSRSHNGLFGENWYGYLEKGCFTLFEALESRLAVSDSFKLLRGTTVERIALEKSRAKGVVLASGSQLIPGDAVVSTVAIPSFTKLIPPLGEYSERLERIEYLNIVCMLMQMDKPLSSHFWTNINDPRIAFNGIIELTNLNPRPDLGRNHLVYIPFYLHSSEPRWGFDDEQLYDECTASLKIVQPGFDRSWVKNWRVSRDQYAQAICRTEFMSVMPRHETPVENLYITDSSQYYPEDRTISASVRLGREVASLLGNRLHGESC